MHRPHRYNVLLSTDEDRMLKVLAERRALSASDYLRQLLRKEFRVESDKWKRSLSPVERAVLGYLADAGTPKEIGEIHSGLMKLQRR